MSLHFSAQPGCWERHLQRQYNNPLFIETAPIINQRQVEIAQEKDQAARYAFVEKFHELLQEFTQLKPQADSEVIFNLQSRIDKLYSDCAGNGGDLLTWHWIADEPAHAVTAE